MVKEYKLGSRRSLPLEKRDRYGYSTNDKIKMKFLIKTFEELIGKRQQLRRDGILTNLISKHIRRRLSILIRMMDDISTVDGPPPEKQYKQYVQRRFEDFNINTYSSRFRFRSPKDMKRLLDGFKLPESIRIKTYRFSGEEILMISLIRLSYPARWIDVQHHFPGRSRQALQAAFYWFLDFMIQQWGYLLLNNREYWLPKMNDSADAIRCKLATLPTINYRQFHPPSHEPHGFSIFAFIDNTMIAMSRPGGPRTDGEQAPRTDNLLQQTWWTGWKKLHGMKWQTITMANGMDFEVWGPVSVRRNDLLTLNRSQILPKLAALQANQQVKFKIFGDSAYYDEEYLATQAGRGMASCRESIEWRYGDVKGLWKYIDYKHCLQLRKQPLGKIIFVCMLLTNAHCSMYGSEASSYFNCTPPSFEDWLSQGPNAKPLPVDIIFNENWVPAPIDEAEIAQEEIIFVDD